MKIALFVVHTVLMSPYLNLTIPNERLTCRRFSFSYLIFFYPNKVLNEVFQCRDY